MPKVLGKGSIVRRDRKRDGTLKDRAKCRLWEISLKLDDGTRKTSTGSSPHARGAPISAVQHADP